MAELTMRFWRAIIAKAIVLYHRYPAVRNHKIVLREAVVDETNG